MQVAAFLCSVLVFLTVMIVVSQSLKSFFSFVPSKDSGSSVRFVGRPYSNLPSDNVFVSDVKSHYRSLGSTADAHPIAIVKQISNVEVSNCERFISSKKHVGTNVFRFVEFVRKEVSFKTVMPNFVIENTGRRSAVIGDLNTKLKEISLRIGGLPCNFFAPFVNASTRLSQFYFYPSPFSVYHSLGSQQCGVSIFGRGFAGNFTEFSRAFHFIKLPFDMTGLRSDLSQSFERSPNAETRNENQDPIRIKSVRPIWQIARFLIGVMCLCFGGRL